MLQTVRPIQCFWYVAFVCFFVWLKRFKKNEKKNIENEVKGNGYTKIILIFMRGNEDICDLELELDRREWRQSDSSIHTKRVLHTDKRWAPPLCLANIQSCWGNRCAARRPAQVQTSRRWEKVGYVSRERVQCELVTWLSVRQQLCRVWKVDLRLRQRAVKNVSSNTRLQIHLRSFHVRGRRNCHSSRVVCFSCVTALKSCTVTTVDFVVLHDNLGGISSVSLGLVCAAVFLSTSLTELLVSAASLHHHPVF